MILAKLTEFAARMGLNDHVFAPIYVDKAVRIDENGVILKIEDCAKRATFSLPREVLRSSNIASQLLWDKCHYLFGQSPAGKEIAKLEEKHAAFLAEHESLLVLNPSDPRLKAVVAFAKRNHKIKDELTGGNYVLFFRDDELPVGSRPELRKTIEKFVAAKGSGSAGVCPITGEDDILVTDLHAKVKPLAGANTPGGSVISFNVPSSWSWGHEGNENFPLGSKVFHGYTTALSWLLSNRRVKISAACTVVWWSDEESPMETLVDRVLHGDHENPDQLLLDIQALDDLSGDLHFAFITGAQGRAQITEWVSLPMVTVKKSLERYVAFFTAGYSERYCPGVRNLLKKASQPDTKGDGLAKVRPFVAIATVRAVVAHEPLPRLLAEGALRELRKQLVSDEVSSALNPTRLRIFEAVFSGEFFMQNGFSDDRQDVPYVLGAQFAVMEELQKWAIVSVRKSGGANISTRFLGEASQRPARVFPHLRRLARHHQDKLNRKRWPWHRYLEGLYLAQQGKLKTADPMRLRWEEQSVFFLGYDHMRAAIYEHMSAHRRAREEAQAAE